MDWEVVGVRVFGRATDIWVSVNTLELSGAWARGSTGSGSISSIAVMREGSMISNEGSCHGHVSET